jgi:hypothetical protein
VARFEVEEDPNELTKAVIAKFQRKGFDGLAVEEVAIAMITPEFGKHFQLATG